MVLSGLYLLKKVLGKLTLLKAMSSLRRSLRNKRVNSSENLIGDSKRARTDFNLDDSIASLIVKLKISKSNASASSPIEVSDQSESIDGITSSGHKTQVSGSASGASLNGNPHASMISVHSVAGNRQTTLIPCNPVVSETIEPWGQPPAWANVSKSYFFSPSLVNLH